MWNSRGTPNDPVTTGDYFPGMKSVGVKQLKAHLSEYLRAVQEGQTVLVTHHDQVIAELRPVRRPATPDQVEAARALLRHRQTSNQSEERLADAAKSV
ncbi:MAG: type II toxin-antitoxin system prevent-host-death family antitoxin [Gemmatimonadota bacterium]|nr:type II toxin-antitoxin system prevent-host-death family antitoxin [Gemmatimonadota bacterium]